MYGYNFHIKIAIYTQPNDLRCEWPMNNDSKTIDVLQTCVHSIGNMKQQNLFPYSLRLLFTEPVSVLNLENH